MDAGSISTPRSGRGRSTRDRPAKPPLSEEAIIEAALAVTRAEGLSAVTMRRVAAELDTGAASLYVYVRNREDLLRLMLDRVFGTMRLEAPDPSRWREQIYELLRQLRDELEAHPGLAQSFANAPPSTEPAMAGLENMFAILLAGGIAPQNAAWACDVLGLIVTATATEADIRSAAGLATEADYDVMAAQMQEHFSGLPPARYPQLVAHASLMVAGDADDRFRFAVDTFLDGLVARTAR